MGLLHGRKETVNLTLPWTIAPSRIQGQGAICTRAVPAGTSVGVAHVWQYGRGRWEPTPDLGRFHNHSSSPSCRNYAVGPYRYLVALRDLQPGDEITVDYRLQTDLEQPGTGWR